MIKRSSIRRGNFPLGNLSQPLFSYLAPLFGELGGHLTRQLDTNIIALAAQIWVAQDALAVT